MHRWITIHSLLLVVVLRYPLESLKLVSTIVISFEMKGIQCYLQ
jgi:hypothetical protein